MKGVNLPQRQLVSQADQARIEPARVPRSVFTNTWSRKTAFDAGRLYPFLVDEVLPGDHMNYRVTAFVRMATMLFPMLDNQRLDTFFFFCPNRLVWPNWVKMMGEQSNPGDSINFTVPQVGKVGPADVGQLYDHMGIPYLNDLVDPDTVWSVNALPFRMYNFIYNQWFRDENMVASATLTTGDGPDTYTDYVLRNRAKGHDYFTSALPWPQKFTAPTVPIAGTAPVRGIGKAENSMFLGPANAYETDRLAVAVYANYSAIDHTDPAKRWFAEMKDFTGEGLEFRPNIYADLSEATGVAINTFRQAFMIQSLLERDARGGTRYTELIRSHFGVINPDFRLQRPEYIGGGQTPINITPIAQTAPTDGVPLGALGAAGTAAGSHTASYAATEHGFIIGMLSIRTEVSYQQGIHKQWTRLSRFDFYWPSLAQLGEQAILRKEIYALGSEGGDNDETVFGYQERWHEYRTRTSEVTGLMRSGVTDSLDAWHLAQSFGSAPVLGTTFIHEDPPMARVLAAGELAAGQQYIADIMIHRRAVRPIPTFGTPATLGRF